MESRLNEEITVQEYASKHFMSISQVRNLIKKKQIKAIRRKRRVYIKV